MSKSLLRTAIELNQMRTRIVEGFEVVSGVPASTRHRSPLVRAMKAMEVDEYIVLKIARHDPFRYAKKAGIKITTQKQKDGTLFVWRVG